MTEQGMTLREQHQAQTGAAMETMVGYLLLGGVVLSIALTVSGLTWSWRSTGALGLDYRLADMNLFQFLAQDLRQLGAGVWGPRLLVNLGIAALLLTPYFRVLASMVFFALVERNWKYTLFTGFVFAVLTYSLFLR
jgi:uncharacterized membrane protein